MAPVETWSHPPYFKIFDQESVPFLLMKRENKIKLILVYSFPTSHAPQFQLLAEVTLLFLIVHIDRQTICAFSFHWVLNEYKDPHMCLVNEKKQARKLRLLRVFLWVLCFWQHSTSKIVCFNSPAFTISEEQFMKWWGGIWKRLKRKWNCCPAVNLFMCPFFMFLNNSLWLYSM